MRKNLAGIYVIFLLFASSVSGAGEFCRVTNVGSTGPCFPTLSSCEFGLLGGGTCVFRDTSASSARPAPGSIDEAYQAGRGLGMLFRALTGESEAATQAAAEREAQQQAERRQQQETDRRNAAFAREQLEQLDQQRAAQSKRERIPDLEKTCVDIGFKKGTPAFGDCVLDLYSRL